ncbi:membrane protein of unknown function [uncultured Woeseiaceae bacterium]|uniref:Glycosyltransferase RgtA/B/C/D-like domain-containing protein n=1 Tax=uncultured Woeseiaceae bacterium TaxID=1983305 RepID=A0A7D9H603_9GAMM|nr:membrane protein of unknown function [uncultured Woeseiaceae bacterium]
MIYENRLRDPIVLILVLILVLAFSLRIFGIWFGLPFVLHDDEPNEVLRALQLGSGSYNFDRIEKGGYFYLLFIEFGGLFVVLKMIGIVQSTTDFAKYFITDPTAFYLIGRGTTAVIGTITVLLVYKIGRLAYSPIAGLMAAGLLAVNVLHAQHSHYIAVDVPMVCLGTASLYYAIRMLHEKHSRNYYLAAMFAALAVSTKLPAALLVIPLTVAHFCYVTNLPYETRRYLLDQRLWLAAIIFIGTYVIATPGIVVHFSRVFFDALDVFGLLSGNGGDVTDIANPRAAAVENINLFYFYATTILNSMTSSVFLICISGFIWGIWKRRQSDLVLISFALAIYVFASISASIDLIYPRYVLPAIPVLTILGGRMLFDIGKLLFESKKVLVITAVAIAAGIMPAFQIAAADLHMIKPDTRLIARAWINQNVPPGSMVFIEGATVRPYESTVPLQNSRDNLLRGVDYFRDKAPGKAKYFELELQVMRGNTYDLLTVTPDDLQSLQYYKDIGVQYFILRPDSYGPTTKRFAWPKLVSEVQFDPEITLLKRFAPDSRAIRGPSIELYQAETKANPD